MWSSGPFRGIVTTILYVPVAISRFPRTSDRSDVQFAHFFVKDVSQKATPRRGVKKGW